MPQARKKVRSKRRRRRPNPNSPPGWAMLLIGLVSGAVLGGLYFGAQSGDGSQFGSGLKTFIEKHQLQTDSATPMPTTTPKQPPPTAKFDFYTVLPEIERVMPDDFGEDIEAERKSTPSTYVLQAASYASYADADRLKAKLALSGFEAKVQKITIQGKGIYYRVRLGPYTSKRKMKNDRQRLARLGIQGLPLKLTTE